MVVFRVNARLSLEHLHSPRFHTPTRRNESSLSGSPAQKHPGVSRVFTTLTNSLRVSPLLAILTKTGGVYAKSHFSKRKNDGRAGFVRATGNDNRLGV